MKRRSFLALLGLAPAAAHIAAKGAIAPDDGASPARLDPVPYDGLPMSAHIGVLHGGVIKSVSGLSLIDLSAGTITFI